MSHNLWWSENLILDAPKEIFLPPTPLSPRAELILRQDPLDVVKSDEYVVQRFTDKPICDDKDGRRTFDVDFNDPMSADATARSLQQQLALDQSIRADKTAVYQLLGSISPYPILFVPRIMCSIHSRSLLPSPRAARQAGLYGGLRLGSGARDSRQHPILDM